MKKPTPVKAKVPSGRPAAGEILFAEAREKYKVRGNTIGIWIKWGKVTGGDGYVNEASLKAHIAAGGMKVERPAKAKKEKRVPKARVPSSAVETPPAPKEWDPANVVGQTYKPKGWIAKKLDMSVDQVEEIIHNGDIAGGDTNANWDQIQAYMKHPDYKALEPVEA